MPLLAQQHQNALLENVSTLMRFQTSYGDAEILSDKVGKAVLPKDMAGLPDRSRFLGLVSGGVQRPPVAGSLWPVPSNLAQPIAIPPARECASALAWSDDISCGNASISAWRCVAPLPSYFHLRLNTTKGAVRFHRALEN